MSEQNNPRREDTYDVLHKKFSLMGDDNIFVAEESDVKNSGEIYFSASEKSAPAEEYDFDRYLKKSERPVHINEGESAGRRVAITPEVVRPASSSRPSSSSYASSASKSSVSAKRTSSAKTGSSSSARKNTGKRKKKKGTKSSLSFLLAGLIIVFVLVASLVIRIPIMGCVSDILAIDRDSTEIRVILEQNSKTKDVISLLGRKKLIYSSGFCKAVSGFLGYEADDIFPAGTYYLSPDMGLEGMLKEIMSAGATEETVTLTFPEGFTIDQIVERLSQNGVASENALYKALNDDSLYEEFDFLNSITDKNERYRALEGYMFPDTYEFYIDENPISVFRRFLDNFSKKWEADFAPLMENSSYSIDEIITVASILEKEAKDAEQMPLIASILYNRLNSSSFPWINCDSTGKYIEAQKARLEEEGTYIKYMKVYDTYQQNGLPIGPICNPGVSAISAAISPDNTDYYYFLHDKDGKIYTARTESEHYANQQYMDTNG